MSDKTNDISRDSDELSTAWRRLLEDKPGMRIRDAAGKLGVAEAQLLATECGDSVTRLDGNWRDAIVKLEALGKVKTITRNDSAVHELTGYYRNAEFRKSVGVVLGGIIDLRVYLNHWHFGFAQDVTRKNRRLRSLQFFDRDGTAVHKVYLTDESDADAYDRFVADYHSSDQSTAQAVSSAAVHYESVSDDQVDIDGLHAYWRNLKNVHYFQGMLKRYRVARHQAMRLGSREFTTPVGVDSFTRLIEAASESGLEIMVFVGSMGVAQIYTGPVERIKRVGEWFNILDPNFNLHLRDDRIASAWIVRKPSEVGHITSLEVYDKDGGLIGQMFGKRVPHVPESKAWRALVDTLEPLPMAAAS